MNLIKEKSWLVDGYVLNARVRSDRCKDCLFNPQMVSGNNDDPDLLLYGCDTVKCKHVLIRVNLAENNNPLWILRSPLEGQEFGIEVSEKDLDLRNKLALENEQIQ